MISRDRRKELLFEIMSATNTGHRDIYLPNREHSKLQIISNLDSSFIFQDKFCLHLQSEHKQISSEKIKGFRIDNDGERKIIKVKTFLHIEDWIKDFEQIDIIRIYFFDFHGNVTNNSFDYDVDFKRFYLDCDYKFQDYMTPIYEYEILDAPDVK